MVEWLEKFKYEMNFIKRVPITFFICTLSIAAIIAPIEWKLMSWHYSILIDTYKQQLDGRTPEEAAKRIKDLEDQVGSPYPFTPVQKKLLGNALDNLSLTKFMIKIQHAGGASDAAYRLGHFFKEHHWPSKVSYEFLSEPAEGGIYIVVSDKVESGAQPMSENTKILIQMFNIAGIRYTLSGLAGIPPNDFFILVAHAPD